MTELTYQGFNYPAFYNGGYENGDTLPALKAAPPFQVNLTPTHATAAASA